MYNDAKVNHQTIERWIRFTCLIKTQPVQFAFAELQFELQS